MRLLDLFCGGGGAGMGYSLAGFEDIVGVDNEPQPRYPFTFVLADALEYLASHGHEFDAIHASPPCQGYSIMRNLPWNTGKEYPLLIDPVRELLKATGKPWIIENVMGAHLPAGWLCGTMFGLPFYRHRSFETSWLWLQPGHLKHDVILGNEQAKRSNRSETFVFPGVQQTTAEAMAIDWMKRRELSQAIPPAYTEFIGKALIQQGES